MVKVALVELHLPDHFSLEGGRARTGDDRNNGLGGRMPFTEGFAVRAEIIWGKTRFIISRGHYHFQHEPCWYAVRKGKTAHWRGDHSQSSLWQIAHLKSDTGHGTQKPVECMKRPIENNSSPGQAVYEPFGGSGTTIIAAEMTGRAAHAIVAGAICSGTRLAAER